MSISKEQFSTGTIQTIERDSTEDLKKEGDISYASVKSQETDPPREEERIDQVESHYECQQDMSTKDRDIGKLPVNKNSLREFQSSEKNIKGDPSTCAENMLVMQDYMHKCHRDKFIDEEDTILREEIFPENTIQAFTTTNARQFDIIERVEIIASQAMISSTLRDLNHPAPTNKELEAQKQGNCYLSFIRQTFNLRNSWRQLIR